MKNLALIFFYLWLVESCSNPKISPYADFIEEHESSSFEIFMGYGIYQRGMDNDGNELIYISKTMNIDSFINSGNVVVAIDSNGKVKYTDSSFDKFGLNIDTLKNIAIRFNSLNINSLSVDYAGKTYFSIYSFDKPDLILLPKGAKAEDIGDDWSRIKENWYERK